MNRKLVQFILLALAILGGFMLFGSQVGARILDGGDHQSSNKTQAVARAPFAPNATGTNTPTASPTCGPAAWTTQASYPVSLAEHAVAAVNGQVYSFGGFTGATTLANAYVYNPANNNWTS